MVERNETAREEIEQTLADMFTAWNRGDVRGYAEFWSEDGELVNVLACTGEVGRRYWRN